MVPGAAVGVPVSGSVPGVDGAVVPGSVPGVDGIVPGVPGVIGVPGADGFIGVPGMLGVPGVAGVVIPGEVGVDGVCGVVCALPQPAKLHITTIVASRFSFMDPSCTLLDGRRSSVGPPPFSRRGMH